MSVSDFAIDFRTLVTSSGWEKKALYDTLLNGLSKGIKEELLIRDLPEDLDDLISLAIRVDTCIQERQWFR